MYSSVIIREAKQSYELSSPQGGMIWFVSSAVRQGNNGRKKAAEECRTNKPEAQ